MFSIKSTSVSLSEASYLSLPGVGYSTRELFLRFLITIAILSIIKYCVTGVFQYFADRKIQLNHGCLPPPELQNHWPFGFDWLNKLFLADAEMRLLPFLCTIADNYEPRNMLSQYLAIGPRAYHILDPQNLEVVLASNFADYGFGVRDEVFAPLLGTGIFTQEGPAWKHSRDMLRKQFVRTQYRSLEPFQEHVDNLIGKIRHEKTQVVDLLPLFFKLTLDTTTALLFGRSVYSLKADEEVDRANVQFAEAFNNAQAGLAKRFRLAPWHFFYSPRKFRSACATVHNFVERYIDEQDTARPEDKNSSTRDSFISQLAAESPDKKGLRDQLLNILLAGRDTTACCLSWTMRLLVRHPQVLAHLQQEVTSTMLPTESPSREQIRKMPYLAAVIKESLRLFPPVPLNNRTATKTTMLPRGGGPDGLSPILVRKGELVVFSQYVNSRRKNIFGRDADDFRPERWQEDSATDQFGWAYFPFNGGPRACLGQDFALMEVSYTVIRLLQTFPDLRLPPGEDNTELIGQEKQRLTLVLLPADGCRVQMI